MSNGFWSFAGNYWWLLFVFGGTIGGAVRSMGRASERRAERRQERFRLKQEARIAAAQAGASTAAAETTQRRVLTRVTEQHDKTNARWLDYELDPVTLIEFPMLTDMREPLTVAFHRAKRHADLLRPERPDELDRSTEGEYRDAVHDYAIAFEVAETEARRRRQRDFSVDEQARLVRAQRLLRRAADEASSPAERQQAYAKARAELDGLMVLPPAAIAAIEAGIAGQLER